LVNSAHRSSDNVLAEHLANDAESRVRGGESARQALQHEAHFLRKLEIHHGHFNSAHFRHEMYLVHRKLDQKLEHDGLLPKMHIPSEGHRGEPRRDHPLFVHKDKRIHRSLAAPSASAELDKQPPTRVEGRTRFPKSRPVREPDPGAAIRTERDGADVGQPKRRQASDVPMPATVPPHRVNDAGNPGTPGQISGWLDIHNHLKSKANATAPDLAFYGDSITDGMSLNNHFANGLGGRAENFGIHSDTTDNLRYRLLDGEMQFKGGKQPKDVVMLIGTNDIGKKAPDQIAHDIIADAELAAKNLPHSKVLLLGLLPRAGAMDEVKEINRQLAAYMSGPHSANLRYADVGSQMLSNGRMVYGPALTKNESQIWQPGGLHPTYGPGYSRLLNAINGALQGADTGQSV
jgi:hypothetical protein